jgi:propanediol dehydratase small subunit
MGQNITANDYPLSSKRPDLVSSATGKKLDEITLEKFMDGSIDFKDIQIRPETLEYQAQIAESAGRPHISVNLRRAAELTRVPDARILEIYGALRPGRSTKEELLAISAELETKYNATICSTFVREAACVYAERGQLKQ